MRWVLHRFSRTKRFLKTFSQLDSNIPAALYIPKPLKDLEQLLTLANIPIPEILPSKSKPKPNAKTKLKNIACRFKK